MPLANVKFPDVNWKAEKRGRNATGAEVAEVDGFKLHVAPQATEGDKKPTDFDWTVMGEKHSDQGTAKTMNGARIRAVEILNRLRRLEDKQRRDAEAEAKAKAKAAETMAIRTEFPRHNDAENQRNPFRVIRGGKGQAAA
jgi:hypothetical protein